MRGLVVPFVLLAGCFESHAPPCTVDCTTDAECPSGLACNGSKCSIEGASCAGAACTQMGAQRCTAEGSPAVEVCTSGVWTPDPACPGACIEDGVGTAHCAHLEPLPAVLATICDQRVPGLSLDLPMMTYSTSQNGNCTRVFPQAGGPDLCVVRAPSILLGPNRVFRVIGERALVLVADRDIDIAGTIDVSATGRLDGPGGGTRVSSGAPLDNRGGGGAGFQSAGAAGGAPAGMTEIPGGRVGEDASTSRVFAGGYRAAGAVSAEGNTGGGGGGALALLSCSGAVTVSGVLDAGGGGGAGGNPAELFGRRSGAGGGSGGVLLLQGMRVAITGQVFANGGGGGGGSSQSGTAGGDGQPGGRSDAMGGSGGQPVGTGGSGGRGGYASEPPATGGAGDTSSGGGGGSVGYIIASTPLGTNAVTTGAVQSPTVITTTAGVR